MAANIPHSSLAAEALYKLYTTQNNNSSGEKKNLKVLSLF
jgi:hypothetical protein